VPIMLGKSKSGACWPILACKGPRSAIAGLLEVCRLNAKHTGRLGQQEPFPINDLIRMQLKMLA
jgi:hypothetical protein